VRRWTINGRFLSQPPTGVQRAAREIVRALDARLSAVPDLRAPLRVDLVAPPGSVLPRDLATISCRQAGPCRGHAWEQLALPALAPGGLLSLCNTGPILHQKQIVCIHDANTRILPSSYTAGFRALYRVLLPSLGRTACAITTVSQHSAQDLDRFGICPISEIAVVPNGHEHALRWTPCHSEQTRAVAGPDTVVLIGSPTPHKNTELILGLAPRLHQAGLRVAVVGANDAQVYRMKLGPAPCVDWLGRLPDEQLAALLRDSLCLVFPSLTEGFGMPPLEAMALGCPTLVSDRASLPEICGDASIILPPDEPERWFESIVALHRSPDLRAQLVAKGRVRVGRFRWENAATAYLGLMAALDGEAVPSFS
jgi:glycosyltransferase involved in cell wall biosynthesis